MNVGILDWNDDVMECMDRVRETGACNMHDRGCVGLYADMMCPAPEAGPILSAAENQKTFYGFLEAFRRWKEGA
jgi:hypothetical protein